MRGVIPAKGHGWNRMFRSAATAGKGFDGVLGRRESDLSYDLLKEAGVDLATSEPYDAAMRRMNTLSDQLQSLLQHLRQ